ncbi:hypothetical protein [Silvibacterium dinghuense]|uniref:Uncharacterized protein n=1 Tax=Silvibacterium dinghuense TaxID=1560006 RepID=A0A4Q1SBI5_9BACT|nr:hypothetical protein [Silvibacterium dinghuense]RXS94504.1 hypothetical protein ESZ00_15670 [Silvibacterium dinghuense]GGH15694.1 hypothetical protein GCM10011586_36960 [Silvibacterium dinghuense]
MRIAFPGLGSMGIPIGRHLISRLFREAAEHAGVATPLADAFADNFRRAIDADMQDADWASG